MKPHLAASPLFALLAFAAPAAAEITFPDRLTPRGSLALMSFGTTGDSVVHTTIIGDLDVQIDIAGGFGVALGATGYRDGVSAIAKHWAATFTAGPMTLSYGTPRPGFDTYARTAFYDRFAVLDENALMYSASYLTLTDLDGGEAAQGVRIDLNTERFDLSVSQHKPEGFGMGKVLSASAALTFGEGFTLSAGYETTEAFMTDITKTKFAVAKDFGKLDVSLATYRFEIDSMFGSSDKRANEIGVNYAFNDRFQAGFAVLDMPDDNKRVTSADVKYRVFDRASLVAGASKTTGQDGLFWGIGLRYDF